VTSLPVKLGYRHDKILEIHLDTTDFFVDGVRGRFPSTRHRDFVVQVARKFPKTAMFVDLEAAIQLGKNESREILKKIAHQVKERFEAVNLQIPVLESARSAGYSLASGWRLITEELGTEHLAYEQLRELNVALDRARAHVDSSAIVTNQIGLLYVERTEATRQLAKDNYTLIEDVGWQLIHVLSSCGVTNEEHPDILEVKKKIEKIISYALFWRLGDSMSKDKFRSDFRSETKKLVGEIKHLISRILDAAVTRKSGPTPP
jgi:hypothetical protein